MSLSLQSNRDNQLYDQQLFNSMTSPMRRPLYLPGPMAKGNMFEGLQMFGDAFTDLKNTFSNRKLKKELYKESLPEYYRYSVEKDPNDPNEYVLDNRDLYDAMMGEGTLRTPDVYQSDLQKYSMVNFDPESGMYNTMYSSRPVGEDVFSEGSKSLGQFLEDMQGNPELANLIMQAEGAPEGFFPYMEPDGRMGVTEDPEYMQYYYNTMMGNYEMGGSLPKAQFRTALEESFANYPPEKIVSTLEKSKRIGDEDYQISMNSYLPEIVIEEERGEQDKGSTLGEMLRFDELLNQPESNEFRINPQYDPNTAIIDNTNVVMPQFDMEGNYMGEGSVNSNVSQYLGDSGGDKRSDLEKLEPVLNALDYVAMVGAFTPAYPLAYGYSMARALQKGDAYAGGADLIALGAKRHPAVQAGLKVFGKLGPKIPSLINKFITKTPARDPIEETINNVYDELMSIPEYSRMGADYLMEEATKIGQGLYDSYENTIEDYPIEGQPFYPQRKHGGLIKAQVGLSFEQWAAQNAVTISGMNEAEARRAYDQDTMDPQEFGEKYMDIDFTVDEVPMPRLEDDPETMPFDLALGDVEIDEVAMPRLEDDVVIANPVVTGQKDNLSRFLDSPFAQGYGAVGRSAVGVAQGLNQMFGLDRVARQAEEDLMRTTSADNAFMVTNPLMPQGTLDVNTGLRMGSGGFGLAKFGTETEMEVEADPETIKALIDAGANVNYI